MTEHQTLQQRHAAYVTQVQAGIDPANLTDREYAMATIREWVADGTIEPQDAVTAAEQGVHLAELATALTGAQ